MREVVCLYVKATEGRRSGQEAAAAAAAAVQKTAWR